MAERPKKKHGPKGGVPHQPGRGHDRKSGPSRARRFRKKAAKLRADLTAEARRQWAEWDALSAEVKKLRDDLKPKLPRPDDG